MALERRRGSWSARSLFPAPGTGSSQKLAFLPQVRGFSWAASCVTGAVSAAGSPVLQPSSPSSPAQLPQPSSPSSPSSPSPAPAGSWPPRTVPRTQAGFLGLQMTSVLFSARVLHTAVCTAGPVWGRGCSCSPVRAGIARRGGDGRRHRAGKGCGMLAPAPLAWGQGGKTPQVSTAEQTQGCLEGLRSGGRGERVPPAPTTAKPSLVPSPAVTHG